MRRFIVRAEQFAEWFHKVVPGAYREITVQNVEDMTTCGLIKRYGFYDDTDLQTVIGILKFERLTQQRTQEKAQEANPEQPRCKSCGQVLPAEPEDKKGRPHEYCPDCESSRSTIRSRKWRSKVKEARN